jgi:predicted transcriptional regulator
VYIYILIKVKKMTINNLNEKILSELKPYPHLTTIPELREKLKIPYTSINFRLMGLVAERKVGFVRKGGKKYFYAPNREDIDENGEIIIND